MNEPVHSMMATVCAAMGSQLLADCLHLFVPCTGLCGGTREAEAAAALQVAGAGGGVKLGVIEKAQVRACLAQSSCGSRLHSCFNRATSHWGRMAFTGLLSALQTAVNTLKVASALNNISEMLKVSHETHACAVVMESCALHWHTLEHMTAHPVQEQAQQAVGTGSTLVNLSAYLTLDRAREKFGFDPANYNLSDNEAGQIATIFSRFDTVSPSEILASIVASFWASPAAT